MLEIDRKKLLATLTPLQSLLKKQSDQDIGSGQLTYSNGRFFCKALDYKLTSLAPKCFKEQEVEPFSVSGDFVTFLQRATADTVQLDFADVLKVVAKRSKTQFSLLEGSVFEFPKTWTLLSDASLFLTCFEKLSKMAARSMSGRFPALSAVHINKSKMEASDGKQYLSMESDTPAVEEDLLIPATAFGFIQSISPIKYHVEDNQIFFRSADKFTGLVGSCPLLGGTFPNMESILSKKGHIVKFSKFINEAVAKCAVFTSRFRFDEEKTFTVKFESEHAVISAISAYGSTTETVKAQYPEEVEGRVIKVNPDLFEECLSYGLEATLTDTEFRVNADKVCYIARLKF